MADEAHCDLMGPLRRHCVNRPEFGQRWRLGPKVVSKRYGQSLDRSERTAAIGAQACGSSIRWDLHWTYVLREDFNA